MPDHGESDAVEELGPLSDRAENLARLFASLAERASNAQGEVDVERLTLICERERDARVIRVAESLRPFDAFDAVANTWYANVPVNPNSYRESEHHGLLAVVEYVAGACLARPARCGGRRGVRSTSR